MDSNVDRDSRAIALYDHLLRTGLVVVYTERYFELNTEETQSENFGRLKVAALAGGVGGAKMIQGIVNVIEPSRVTAIVNTGDDTVLHGLRISPDLDTVTYTLAGMIDREKGWGLADESWTVMETLAEFNGETWFRLGDRDIALHMLRTDMLGQGATLSEVTSALCAHFGIATHVLPMSDDPVETVLTLMNSGEEISFQEYFVKLSHAVPVSKIHYSGVRTSVAAPGVIEALVSADVIVICPSNPFLSILPILSVPDISELFSSPVYQADSGQVYSPHAGKLVPYRSAPYHTRADQLPVNPPIRAKTVAISPIIDGKAVKGPADRLLGEMGLEPTAAGVAKIYKDIASVFIIDNEDAKLQEEIEAMGMRCLVTNSIMNDVESSRNLATEVIRAAIQETSRHAV
jgi:LPPG:FO 2-phospho-L-lactate transferase